MYKQALEAAERKRAEVGGGGGGKEVGLSPGIPSCLFWIMETNDPHPRNY
jgi:hypothetical protein